MAGSITPTTSYTLTVNFTTSGSNPTNYRIRYWPTSNPTNITTEFVTTSPFIASYLPSCSYQGTIEAGCPGGTYSAPQSFSASKCSLPYTPCAFSADGNITAADVYLAAGVEDIATGVQLYDSQGGILTGVIYISDSNGTIFNVGTSGIVGTSTGNSC